MSHDYIPKNDDELLVFTENLYAYALANYARLQVPSPQSFLNKNETKKALDSALRTYIQGFIARNPAVRELPK